MEQKNDIRYLKLLAEQYPSIHAASTDIIRLNAELNLPKGTEHFISDIHGEYEAFQHVLKNGSGSIKRKIEDVFGSTLSGEEKRSLATLIYYPEKKLSLILQSVEDKASWYQSTLLRLIELGQVVSSKYTRSTVRQFLPDSYADIIDDLLYENADSENKTTYYHSLIESIIRTGSARAFMIALAELIQRLAIARLHIIGDVYDRGPGAHLIMDALMDYHSVDIQWGNHDILWMAAAAGSEACIANVIRISLRYTNTETLENGYGISLLPLASLAIDTYGDDPSQQFIPKDADKTEFTPHELKLMAQMHKAITLIQFKLEGQIIRRRSHYQMDDRLLLDKIDHEKGTVRIGDREFPLVDTHFPTLDPQRPYELTEREKMVIEKLAFSFTNSNRLQRHVRFLYAKGSMYLVHNGNLLYHGCIAMNEDGTFKPFRVDGRDYSARAFMDRVERLARQGYFADDPPRRQYGLDAMWYLWAGPQSPLFGKEKMATFERYFIADASTHTEERNAYYDLRDREDIADKILAEFGLDPQTAHIINGHVPVKVKKGESPLKANGKLLVIDGGLAKAYQKQTGIAGYTLVYNSHGLLLAAHHPFESQQEAIEKEVDIDSDTRILETQQTRLRVRDTDEGRKIQQKIEALQELLNAYRAGTIKEKDTQ